MDSKHTGQEAARPPVRKRRGSREGSASLTALVEREGRYRQLVEGSLAGVYIIQGGKFIYANPRLGEIFGYRPEEIIGLLGPEDLTHPDDWPKVAENIREKLADELDAVPLSFRGRRRDGVVVNCEVLGRLGDYQGQPAIFGTLLDVTARSRAEEGLREKEEALEALVQASPQPIVVLDREARVEMWNAAAERVFGWRAEEVVGRLYPLLTEEALAEFDVNFPRLLAGEVITGQEIRRQRKDGSFVDLSLNTAPLYDSQGRVRRVMGILVDISARKRGEEALKASEQRYRAVVEDQTELVTRFRPDGQITFINEANCRYFGLDREHCLGTSFLPLIPEAEREAVWRNICALSRENPLVTHEHRVRTPDGRLRWQQWTNRAIFDDRGDLVEFQAVGRDITERKLAEEALRQSEANYRTIFEAVNDAIVVMDPETGNFLESNQGSAGMLGYSLEEISTLNVAAICLEEPPYSVAEARRWMDKTFLEGPQLFEWLARDRDGNPHWVEVSLKRTLMGGGERILAAVRDISERKQSEAKAEEIRRQHEAILNNIPDIAWLKDRESRLLAVNEPCARVCGLTPAEMVGKTDLDIFPLGLALRYRRDDEEVMRTGQWKRVEEPLADKENKISWIETIKTPFYNDKGEVIGTVGIARDISARRRMEEALKKASRALKAITECRQAMLRATSETELLHEVCRIIVEVGGYRMAWVGYAQQDAKKRVRPVAIKGFDDGYVKLVRVTWAETGRGLGPVGISIRTGEPAIVRDVRSDPRFEPWRAEAQKRGFTSVISLPLKDNQTFGALAIYAAEADAFDDEEVELLMGLANDLAYGIKAHRAEAERRRAERALGESEKKLRSLTTQLLTAQESERRRVSRELHDELGQALTVMKIHLVTLEKDLGQGRRELKERYECLLDDVDRIIENVRRLSWDLSPSILEDLGLTSSLGHLIEDFCQSSQIAGEVALDDINHLFSPGAQINIYRLLQEALNNVSKHAQATRLKVIIQKQARRVHFQIEDNGKGFEVEQARSRKIPEKRLGLTAMYERARMLGGALHIRSRRGRGTRIEVSIPIK